jgi:hypothetical protein
MKIQNPWRGVSWLLRKNLKEVYAMLGLIAFLLKSV